MDNTTLLATLRRRHPSRFARHAAVNVGPGWHGIIVDLLARIDRLLSPEEVLVIHAIHGADGTLSMISLAHGGTAAAVRTLFDEARAEAARRCECCGRPGIPHQVGEGTRIRCHEHTEANDG